MFAAEARGLAWLAEAALRVPGVLAVGQDPDGPAFLVLELIRSAPRRRDFDEQLGRGLAALHRFGAPASASITTTSSAGCRSETSPSAPGPSSTARSGSSRSSPRGRTRA